MNIGINASTLIHPNPTGIEKYSYEIITHLIRCGVNENFILYTPSQLPNDYKDYQKIIKAKKYWTQIRLPIELISHRPDVFFQPSYMIPAFCPCPSVVTIHDLAWIYFPNAYTTEQIRSQKIALNRARRLKSTVIVPSNATKVDCIKYGQIAPESVHIIPEALFRLPKPDLHQFPNIAELQGKRVILSVGRIEKRKNQITLIKALNLLKKRKDLNNTDDIVLAIVGNPGVGADECYAEINKAKKSGLNIIVRSGATDLELASWYSISKLLVYPSLYEGFGLPILEAFAFKIPVICAKNSSLPEVAGNAAWYLDNPEDEEEQAVAINAMLNDPSKMTRLINLGDSRLIHFSWEKAANQTLAVFKLAYNVKNS